ncbi:MAG: hypothetical protein KJ767_04285 [Nanoarchaeota archaeon]|nr:hypothetical protein [Nanoarchaeota archaeon]
MDNDTETEWGRNSTKNYYELEKRVIRTYEKLSKKNPENSLLKLIEIKGSILKQDKEYWIRYKNETMINALSDYLHELEQELKKYEE